MSSGTQAWHTNEQGLSMSYVRCVVRLSTGLKDINDMAWAVVRIRRPWLSTKRAGLVDLRTHLSLFKAMRKEHS